LVRISILSFFSNLFFKLNVSLNEFENKFPLDKGKIFGTFNCHGFTLSEGKYFINSDEATKIFEDEYEECQMSNADVVVFYSKKTNLIEHSGKFNKNEFKIDDKRGVMSITKKQTIEDVLSVESYKHLIPKYLKKSKL